MPQTSLLHGRHLIVNHNSERPKRIVDHSDKHPMLAYYKTRRFKMVERPAACYGCVYSHVGRFELCFQVTTALLGLSAKELRDI